MEEKPICGIIMPISKIEDCDENHWLKIKEVIENAIINAGFYAKLVSSEDSVNIIQENIFNNIYNNPIVVCDVSCNNPNVMFELGMRIAFNLPVVILKDEKTKINFDVNIVEHVVYSSNLQEIKTKLPIKITETYKKYYNQGNSQMLNRFLTCFPSEDKINIMFRVEEDNYIAKKNIDLFLNKLETTIKLQTVPYEKHKNYFSQYQIECNYREINNIIKGIKKILEIEENDNNRIICFLPSHASL